MCSHELIMPKFELLDTCAQDVREITKPLQKMGITLFSHTRVYKDNTFIDISDRADMLDYFYYKTDIYKHYLPDVNPWAFKDKYFLCNTLDNNPSIIGLRNELNIDNIITLIERYETHCELFHFGSTANNFKMINIYLNNLDVLKSFSLFFNDIAKSLIKECEKNRFLRPTDINEYFHLNAIGNDSIDKNQFYSNLNIKGIHFNYHNQSIKLTIREVQILKWSLLGKTASEIAIILAISPRTSENHINNIKVKLGCTKITDIVRLLMEAGVVDLIVKLF